MPTATRLLLVLTCALPARADEPGAERATAAMHRAVSFFREHVAAGGGYVYRTSADLAKREGEGRVGTTTAWLQPPGTPEVGMAYLEAYRLCGDEVLLEAARETAGALVRGQLESGGWDNLIEFAPEDRARYAYRVDEPDGSKRRLRNTTTFDDDKSQSAVRFLVQLDRELDFADETLHEATRYALDSFVRAQYANGAWPQRYDEFPNAADHPPKEARYPETWSRTFPNVKYGEFYTLNDGAIADLVVTMLDAADVYGKEGADYRRAAERAGDFLVRAQLPEPQPAWAQQYDADMQPAWARKFEPPSITGGESQGAIDTLLLLYRRTGDERFLEPIPRAIAYLRKSQLDDGRLARFYELETNRPLYFTTKYELTYDDGDLPTHYGFKVGSKLDRLQREYDEVRRTPRDELWRPRTTPKPRMSDGLAREATRLIESLDDRGAWVEEGRLRYHGDDDPTRRVIESRTFARNLIRLATFVGAARGE